MLTGRAVTWAGLVINVLLAVAKVLAGVVFRSQAILADGCHSASDLVSDFAVLASLRVSKRPADACHPYGHRRVSTLAGLFVGAMLIVAAAWIIYDAIDSYRGPHDNVRGLVPLLLALVTIPVKEGLYQVTRYVGRRKRDMSLLANAWHHRTDAFSSVAAAAGLAGVALGGTDWQFLDHLTALALGVLLVAVAVRIMIQSSAELVDRAPSEATVEAIEKIVAETQGVRGYHAFRARQVGGKVEMDVHVQVDGSLTVAEGHDTATAVRQRVQDADADVVKVIVHVEPASD